MNAKQLIESLESLTGKKVKLVEGSLVIGHTRRGMPVYDNANHASHQNFTGLDDIDALEIYRNYWKMYKEGSPESAKFAVNVMNQIENAGDRERMQKLAKVRKPIDYNTLATAQQNPSTINYN
jgi:hypothetical protein